MKEQIVLGLLRISLGFTFLWAFFDKLLGLGFATESQNAWIHGGSPTYGFLTFGTHGPFKDIFASMAGNPIVDWLFMLGLLGVGVGITLGIARKLSTSSGSLMLLLMYLAAFPPENNPVIDDHIIYILALQLILHLHSGEVLGFGKAWKKLKLVKTYSFLE